MAQKVLIICTSCLKVALAVFCNNSVAKIFYEERWVTESLQSPMYNKRTITVHVVRAKIKSAARSPIVNVNYNFSMFVVLKCCDKVYFIKVGLCILINKQSKREKQNKYHDLILFSYTTYIATIARQRKIESIHINPHKYIG